MALWDEVRVWGLNHGYTDLPLGCLAGTKNTSKGPNHPVNSISWYDIVKWCNARSQMEDLVSRYFGRPLEIESHRCLKAGLACERLEAAASARSRFPASHS